MGVHPLGHDLDAAGLEADRQRRDRPAAQFGSGVALSADGNTALIGGPSDNSGAGAAWVFTRSGATWTQQGAKLTGSGATGAGEQRLERGAVGGREHGADRRPSDNGVVGAAWVFTRSGTTWTQQGAKLTGSGAMGENSQGFAVALSADGRTALIGGPADNDDAGAAWAFTRAGTPGRSKDQSSSATAVRGTTSRATAWRCRRTADRPDRRPRDRQLRGGGMGLHPRAEHPVRRRVGHRHRNGDQPAGGNQLRIELLVHV